MSFVANSSRSRIEQTRDRDARAFSFHPRIPFSRIVLAVALADVVLIIALSTILGVLYETIALHEAGYPERSLGIGIAVTIYFVAINGYRGNYAFNRLLDWKR